MPLFNLISRLLPLHALLVILFAFGAAEPARAQLTFPTPTKTLCVGDPVVTAPTTCTPASPPNSAPLGQMVFYSVTLTPNATGNVTLLETLPPASDFSFIGAFCTVVGSTRPYRSPIMGTSGGVTTLGYAQQSAGRSDRHLFHQGHVHSCRCNGDKHGWVGSDRTPVSNPATYTVFVKPTGSILSDLSVVKTVTPTAVNVTNGPQTVTYTIVIKNNGPQDAYIGPIAQLFDKVSTLVNSVPMQVSLVPGSIQVITNSGACPSSASPPAATSCLDPNPAFMASPGTEHSDDIAPRLRQMVFPGNSAQFDRLHSGERHDHAEISARDPAAPRSVVRAGRRDHPQRGIFRPDQEINGVTITEIDNSNNTSHADVAVNTGQNNDPDCALSSPGPIVISKTQLPPTGLVAWTDSL